MSAVTCAPCIRMCLLCLWLTCCAKLKRVNKGRQGVQVLPGAPRRGQVVEGAYIRVMASTQRLLTHELRFAHLASGARIAWARCGRSAHSGAPTLLRVAHWMTHVEMDLRSALWQPWQIGRAHV